MRGNVAGATGVVVVAPGAAHVAGLFQNDEVVLFRLLQGHAHAEPGEAGADNGNVEVLDVGFLHGGVLEVDNRCCLNILLTSVVVNNEFQN